MLVALCIAAGVLSLVVAHMSGWSMGYERGRIDTLRLQREDEEDDQG